MIKELHEFFSKCPLLGGAQLDVDHLSQNCESFTIEAIPCEPVIKRYYTGGSLRQYCFVIAIRRPYSMTPGGNIKNEQLCEELADWAEDCSAKAELPKLPDGLTSQRLEVTSGGYMFDETHNNARYQIGLRLTYTQM